MAIRSDEITSIIKSEIKGFDAGADVSGVGTIVEVGDARVQHDDVELPDRVHHLVEGTGHRRGVGDVAHHHPRAGPLHLRPDMPREGDDIRPRLDEPTDHREPDPRGSPGDHGRPSR